MNGQEGFALWLTGIPSSGKSTIARRVAAELRSRGIAVIVLESDEMRRVLAPEAGYSEKERDWFYRELALIGQVISRNGVNLIFDATANKRVYRDFGRSLINRFMEIYVRCPLEVCIQRDPKGIYAQAALKKATTVPGVQALYEPPVNPELTLDGQEPASRNAGIIMDKLKDVLYL